MFLFLFIFQANPFKIFKDDRHVLPQGFIIYGPTLPCQVPGNVAFSKAWPAQDAGLARNSQVPESPPYLRLICRFFKRPGFLQSIEGGERSEHVTKGEKIFSRNKSHHVPTTNTHLPFFGGNLQLQFKELHMVRLSQASYNTFSIPCRVPWDGRSGATRIHPSQWPPLTGQQVNKWPQEFLMGGPRRLFLRWRWKSVWQSSLTDLRTGNCHLKLSISQFLYGKTLVLLIIMLWIWLSQNNCLA